jgi:hypothetical protein
MPEQASSLVKPSDFESRREVQSARKNKNRGSTKNTKGTKRKQCRSDYKAAGLKMGHLAFLS